MTATAHTRPKSIIRRTQLEKKLGLSRSAIYSKLKPNPKRPNDYDPTFPKPIRIGSGGPSAAVGWYEDEVDAWLESRQRAA